VPDLTVVLDLPADEGMRRVTTPDRLESEPLAFHERVRERFLDLARRGGSRYQVVDATLPPDEVTEAVRARLAPVLPLSAIQQAELAEARRLEEEQRRVAEAARLLDEARAAAEAEERERVRAAEEARRREAEQAALEQRRRQAEREAEEQARLAAVAAAEDAAREAQREAQRASELEERRRRRHAERAARAESHHAPPPEGPGEATAPLSPPADPPTRELSLTDELFGVDEDDERTVQLPQVRDRDDR
jgi:dTMP kinase